MAPLIISISGVRGIVGESLSPSVAVEFAQAYGTFLRRQRAGERACQQKQEDIVVGDEFGDAEAETAIAEAAETGENPDDTTILPISEDVQKSNNKVIKEIAGLSDDSELSEEEELEAIRSGWGTWRTADGPETVLSQ